ncbi:OLC1v1001977C1 [Oldenlandia corymbosa var. corymbosa]|uniref:OLC1v1001977C1 n=1 Tax=Oldenlandia corymbosa var. corymbosa TaxID=529605 RepID=A0AAV1D7R0_OLDCO|nr:OLC1v1001977C1 [Oldenlandia corymbosa var. corymbosa]
MKQGQKMKPKRKFGDILKKSFKLRSQKGSRRSSAKSFSVPRHGKTIVYTNFTNYDMVDASFLVVDTREGHTSDNDPFYHVDNDVVHKIKNIRRTVPIYAAGRGDGWQSDYLTRKLYSYLFATARQASLFLSRFLYRLSHWSRDSHKRQFWLKAKLVVSGDINGHLDGYVIYGDGDIRTLETYFAMDSGGDWAREVIREKYRPYMDTDFAGELMCNAICKAASEDLATGGRIHLKYVSEFEVNDHFPWVNAERNIEWLNTFFFLSSRDFLCGVLNFF